MAYLVKIYPIFDKNGRKKAKTYRFNGYFDEKEREKWRKIQKNDTKNQYAFLAEESEKNGRN